MAAPSITARGTPSGWKMVDGFSTTIVPANKPAINFWEKTVKPFGVEGGDLIESTTMLNLKKRTFEPRKLQTDTECTASVFYDPDVIIDIRAQINVNQSWTVHYPDGSAEAVFAVLTKFERTEHKEGEPPLANITIVPTNWDPVNKVEADSNFQAAAGT